MGSAMDTCGPNQGKDGIRLARSLSRSKLGFPNACTCGKFRQQTERLAHRVYGRHKYTLVVLILIGRSEVTTREGNNKAAGQQQGQAQAQAAILLRLDAAC